MSRIRTFMAFLIAPAAALFVLGETQAQPRHNPFFPGFRPNPPTTTSGTPTTTTTTTMQNPRIPGIFFLQQLHQQQLLTQMMLMQDQALQLQMALSPRNPYAMPTPVPYPYPMPVPAANNNVNLPAAINNANVVPGFLTGIVDARGQLVWPLGIQILSPPLETKELRQRLEGLLQAAATQGTRVQAGTIDDASKVVAELRRILRRQREGVPEATVRDAEAFLTRLDEALKAMRY